MVPSFLTRDRDRIVVTHVCRHWRDTFLSTPTLWGAVTAFRNLDKTIAYLERSGNTPLNVSITGSGPEFIGWSTSLRVLGQHSHRFGAMKLHHHSREDVFAIMENPLPRLTKLVLKVPDRKVVRRIEGPHLFPPLESLTLHGGFGYLRCFQPHNLRKLGVKCYELGFQLLSLLEFLAGAPLLEELEFMVDQRKFRVVELGEDVPPVNLEHLRRIVFRGTHPKSLRSLTSHIIHPHHTKIVLSCYLPGNSNNLHSCLFPQGMQLPIPTPPKYIRYRVIHDERLSETSTCIDLISADGCHTLIKNCHGWPDGYSLKAARTWTIRELDGPCLKFLQTIDLSYAERLCFERCDPNPVFVEELLGKMDKLETLVVVNGDPYAILVAMQFVQPPNAISPLMRRLVVRCDLPIVQPQWLMIVELMRARAAHGSPLERVTLVSSFSGLPVGPRMSVELLEAVAEVRCDLGRDILGWEWWKE